MKNSSKTINWICGGIAAYFAGITIAGAIKRKREQESTDKKNRDNYERLNPEDMVVAIKEDKIVDVVKGVGATRKRYYVYAGYYENYISSKPMPAPYVLRKTFSSINRAIDYAESFGDTVIYCDNVKYDLPDFIYEALQDSDYANY